jgi:signal transduction histidine kinase
MKPSRRCAGLSLLVLIFVAFSAPVTRAMDTLYISEGFAQRSDSIPIWHHWAYKVGDDSNWAVPSYSDSNWVSVSSGTSTDPGGWEWQGLLWFRVHLVVDSAMRGKDIAFHVTQRGASEIYVNGTLVCAFGKVGTSEADEDAYVQFFGAPLRLSLGDQRHQVLAIRYSSFATLPPDPVTPDLTHFGFVGHFQSVPVAEAWYARQLIWTLRHQMFLTSFALAFCLLHLFVFLFYRNLRSNLYYAYFTASIAALTFFPAQLGFTHEPGLFILYHALFKVSILATSLFGMLFLYNLFYDRIPRWATWAAYLGGLLALGVLWVPRNVVYLYSLLILADMTKVVIVAVVKRKSGSRLVGSGYLVFGLASAWQMIHEIGALPDIHPGIDQFIFMYGTAVMLLTMSIHLAWQFASTNRNLEAQLHQVEELSEITLAQEKAAVEQEAAQKLLRAEIEHQQKELAEARKLEKALADLEHANRHLKDTQTQLVQSEKMASLGMLVAGVAHEINTPVGAISSMHETLVKAVAKVDVAVSNGCSEQCDVKEKTSKPLQIIGEANRVIAEGTGRVTNIVRRLRSFARLDEAELIKADINDGLEDTLILLHHELKHTIEVVREYGDLPRIPCYAAQLNQVFLNLLVNARQAIKGKGTITIRTALRGDRVVVEIRDTGEGIPGEQLGRIFDPGYTTKGVGVGTGLGLSICYQIVESHRGRIEVESEVGKGTTFTVSLPTTLDLMLHKQDA